MFQVLLGGGRRHWLPKVAHDPELTKEEGRRLDGRNLIDDWVRDKKKRSMKAQYVWNKGQLDQIDPNQVDYLLGKIHIKSKNVYRVTRIQRVLIYLTDASKIKQ